MLDASELDEEAEGEAEEAGWSEEEAEPPPPPPDANCAPSSAGSCFSTRQNSWMFPSDCRTALMKQVLPRLRRPTRFLARSPLTLELLEEEDGKEGAEGDALAEEEDSLRATLAGLFSAPPVEERRAPRLEEEDDPGDEVDLRRSSEMLREARFLRGRRLRLSAGLNEAVATSSRALSSTSNDRLNSCSLSRRAWSFSSGVSFKMKSSQR